MVQLGVDTLAAVGVVADRLVEGVAGMQAGEADMAVVLEKRQETN